MQPTHLLYLEDFSLLTAQATVIDVIAQDDKQVIILDQTVFYPQGGGQPYDKGVITSDNATFIVQEVRFVDGIVKHIGVFASGMLQIGETVNCTVEKDRRHLHCRLHSGGHVVDMAVNALKLEWTPGKGYHFPEGPYVEYSGVLPEDKENLRLQIEKQCNELIAQQITTTLQFMNKEEMQKICRFVSDALPSNKPLRVVMYGNFAVPCGGTHVANLADIKGITIRKISTKGDAIRVSYAVV
jgi:Ser-tRNA(Ala) deacylase AlaX